MASDHEDEDDDLYGTSDPKIEQTKHTKDENDGSSGDEPMDEGADSGRDDDDDDDGDDDDDDDDDSESDLEIIIDKPPSALKSVAQHQPQESKAIKIEAPNHSTSTPAQPAPKSFPTGTVPQLSTISGASYPAQKTSTIDVNGNPVYPPAGKPIAQVDLDADLAEEQRIWRHPGQDQSDYFNYGFDEFTWETYRQRQMTMADTKSQSEVQLKQFQQMMGGGGPMPGPGPAMGGGGGGGNNGPPSGMSAIEQQHMEMVMQQMMAQNMDISQVDANTFMQMASQMAGQGMPGPTFGGPAGSQAGFQQGNQGGGRGGRGGRGRGW